MVPCWRLTYNAQLDLGRSVDGAPKTLGLRDDLSHRPLDRALLVLREITEIQS